MKRVITAVLIALLRDRPRTRRRKLTFDGALRRALEVNNTIERPASEIDVAVAQANKD